MSGSDIPEVEHVVDLTPADMRRAQLRVCADATDVDDARELLDMLGLLS